MKFRTMDNIGKAKYTISKKAGKHKDGSDFYDIEIFSNKRKYRSKIRELLKDGYVRLILLLSFVFLASAASCQLDTIEIKNMFSIPVEVVCEEISEDVYLLRFYGEDVNIYAVLEDYWGVYVYKIFQDTNPIGEIREEKEGVYTFTQN